MVMWPFMQLSIGLSRGARPPRAAWQLLIVTASYMIQIIFFFSWTVRHPLVSSYVRDTHDNLLLLLQQSDRVLSSLHSVFHHKYPL
jgi:Kef-type K+ transport system membrane component KefB